MATAMLGDKFSSVVGKFHIHMFNQKEIMAPQLLFIPFYKKQ